MAAGQGCVVHVAAGCDRDPVRPGPARRIEDLHVATDGRETAVDPGLPGEPQRAAPIKRGGVDVGRRARGGQGELADLRSRRVDPDDRVQAAISDPRCVVGADDDPVGREPAPRAISTTWPLDGSSRPSLPEPCAVYQTLPSAATATSWGWEPAGTSYSCTRGGVGAGARVVDVVVVVGGLREPSRSPVSPEPQLVTSTSARQAVAGKRPARAGTLAGVLSPLEPLGDQIRTLTCNQSVLASASHGCRGSATSTCSRACELERNRAGRPRSVWGCCVATVPPVALADFERNREPSSSRRGTGARDISPRHRPPVALRAVVSALLGIGALAFAVALMISDRAP